MGVSFVVFPCCFFLFSLIYFSSGSEVVTIHVNEAKNLLQSGYRYIDVRTVEEFEKGHVEAENILNIPYLFITPEGRVKNPEFLKEGFKNVHDMGGGYLAWVENGHPIKMEEPKKVQEPAIVEDKPNEEL
ncbi:hypothetical protein GOBAR_AA35256 [Gossypium barbadense]|uniref:Rhodanese domain-containing protein n=1 Tax=Gossypium barbadense TaxID=3634 RepID=A0A2P5W2U6_GOSBA|nr:hypothetical protein GOBAR_AA35256 [Gossypium barbadense]